jgi:hypothetical protein
VAQEAWTHTSVSDTRVHNQLRALILVIDSPGRVFPLQAKQALSFFISSCKIEQKGGLEEDLHMDHQTANAWLERIQSEFPQVPVAVHEVLGVAGRRMWNIALRDTWASGSQEWVMETPQEVEHWIELARQFQRDPTFFEHPQHEQEAEWADSVRLVLRDEPEED